MVELQGSADMSAKDQFGWLNSIACGLFILALLVTLSGYLIAGGLAAMAAWVTYLYCVIATRCKRCGKRLLIQFKGPFVAPASFPMVCRRCGLETQIDVVNE